jgi:hypothetical protein
MNKKLLVVLVVVTAILVTGAWVLAAKRSPTGTEGIKPAPEGVKRVEAPAKAGAAGQFTHQQNATPMPEAPAIAKQTANRVRGARGGTPLSVEGLLPEKPTKDRDICDFWGEEAWYNPGWLWGNEYICNFQDPAFGYPYCPYTDVFPMKVTEIWWELYVDVAIEIDWQGFVYANIGTDCPYPGDVLCSTPVTHEVFDEAGFYYLSAELTQPCCVYEPYFAGVYLATDVTAASASHVWGTDGLVCQGYYQYDDGGWEDLVVDYGMDGAPFVNSWGYTRLQNDCDEQPICCQFSDHCESLTPTACIDAGGTPCPYNDARYECLADVCRLPWMGDTCGVTSVVPPVVQVLAGETANFTANVYFQGNQTSCMLTVTPDPACPSCVTTITPNPVDLPATSATISIQTDASTPAGDYVFDVNGAKVSATVRVVEPSPNCELYRDDESFAWFYGSWNLGDQQAIYCDPAAQCASCGNDVYPFKLNDVKLMLYNPDAAAYTNVVIHLYGSSGDPCDGPQAEIYSFPIDNITTFLDWVIVSFPEVVCVNGPFFLALEYNYDPDPKRIPSLVWTTQDYLDVCSEWVFRTGAWYEWSSFWSSPEGYMSLRATGTCQGNCPVECNLIQDAGVINSYFGSFAAGDVIAKYFNPELYCEEPVYPLKIHDVDFLLYNPWGTPSVDIIVDIDMVCHDSCDGPGTPIYRSEPFTITTFYPNMAHIDLNDVVCVNEPFFITLEYASGLSGSTPSFLWPNYLYPCDSCHVWMYWASGGYPFWIEWNDFWAPPVGGCPIIRVSAATNHPDCVQEPCDTVINILADHGDPAYIWALPSTSGRNYPNERFNLPADFGGRLDSVGFYFYNLTGDPNPTIYVWTTDGAGHPWDNNPPYQALGEFQIPTSQINPDGMTWISTWQRGLKFAPEAEFFVGYSFVFDTGDKLDLLSDDYTDPLNTSTRAGFYWPSDDPPDWLNVYESYGIYMSFVVEAAICAEAPPAPTFTLNVTPSPVYVTPGDPPVHYTADIGQVLGYSQPVTLDLADVSPSPAPGTITVTFTPNGQACPYSSDVAVTADAMVPYGIYALTIRGTGAKDIVRTKIVNLIVQPPFDERDVAFYHGSQKASNFGAVGNDQAANNFLWYNRDYQLFDGSFIVATTDPDHMAFDVYDCVHLGWTPTEHESCYFDPDYNANICYGNFFTTEDVISCEYDSVFIVGIMDPCIDFSIKIKVYYNPTDIPIVGMYPAMFEDWDIGWTTAAVYNNTVEMDPDHNLMWQYETAKPDTVFGIMKAPFDTLPMYNMVAVANWRFVWPNSGFCTSWGLDSLYYLISTPGYYNTAPSDTDMSILMTAQPIDLAPHTGKHIEVWIDFGFAGNFSDPDIRRMWWHRVLRYAGFYRGDVNASDSLEVPSLDVTDLAYLINYLFLTGTPAPLPYKDQGDVNADHKVDVLDVVYLINYVFIDGPPPIDYIRFIPQMWSTRGLFDNPKWR